MQQTLNSQVQSILEGVAKQTNKSVDGILGDFGKSKVNYVDMKQSITNYITQIADQSCNAKAVFEQNGDITYVSNSTIGGFAGFQIGGEDTSVSASCSMSNTAKAVVYNQERSKMDQSNTSVSLIGIIIIGIVICSLIGGIVMMTSGGGSANNPQEQLSFYEKVNKNLKGKMGSIGKKSAGKGGITKGFSARKK
jgi:hypothetical protein